MPSKTHSEKKEYYHNKGEKDASKGEYNKPYDFFPDERQRDLNKSYREGWRNTKDQKK